MAPIDYSIRNIEEVVRPHIDGTIKNVEHSRLTAPGENYLSLVLRVDFEVEKRGLQKKVSTVAKRVPMGNQEHMGNMHCKTMENEIKWYLEIVPLLESFANEYGVKLDLFPKCFGARYSLDASKKKADKESVLLLENLHPEGFANADRYIGFDLPATHAVLKQLALFHVLPIALKTNKPQSFDIFKRYLDESKPPPPPGDGDKPRGPPGMKPGQKKPEEQLLDAMKAMPDMAPYILKIEDVLKRCKMGPDEEFHETEEPWNTVVHGDCWVNNIMIKEAGDKRGVQVKLVDFQMLKYGSFAHDLVFCLLSSVQNDVLKEHIDDLLQFYYDEFNSLLSQFEVNLELPHQIFLDEVKRAAYLNEVGHALVFSTIIFGEKGTGPDGALGELDFFAHFSNIINNMNSYHKEKLGHVAAEAVRKGWI